MKSYIYFIFLLLPFASQAQFVNNSNNNQKAGVNINYTESRGSLLEVYYSKQLSRKNAGRVSIVSDFSSALHVKLGWRISIIRIKNLILGTGLDIRYYATQVENKLDDGIMLDLPLYIDYNLSEQFVLNFDFNYPILQLSKRKKYRISEHEIMNFGVGYRF